jgi:MarR family transcriptional repressor of emrRAB
MRSITSGHVPLSIGHRNNRRAAPSVPRQIAKLSRIFHRASLYNAQLMDILEFEMSCFDATSQRLQHIHERMPGFPLEAMRLSRMACHLQKNLKDLTNAALKKHDLVDASYMVLAILYGTAEEKSTASRLGEACHEKPANLTRVCNELELRGLITRCTCPGDRRSVMISLTESGRDLVAAALPDVWQKTSHAYDGFSADELQQLEQLFTRQLRNLNSVMLAK